MIARRERGPMLPGGLLGVGLWRASAPSSSWFIRAGAELEPDHP